jgi:GNAT superfamily N-acetyltransferase
MSVVYRAIREHELGLAVDLFLSGLERYAARKGLPPPTSYTPESIAPVYRHLFETGIFEVAERDGRIVTICAGIMRGDVWFLSMFWARPDCIQQGIGRPLLDRVFDAARERGARVFATWSSMDFTALASYMKLGLLPGGPIFTFAGAARAPETKPGLSARALSPSVASDIDRVVRGAARPEDHDYFIARGARGFEVYDRDRLLGYFYLNAGVIGPAAWLEPEDGAALLGCALREAAAQSADVKLMFIGTNETALRVALESGLRLVGTAHWLRSAEFGKLDQYLASGPAVF